MSEQNFNGFTKEEIFQVPGQMRMLLTLGQFINEKKAEIHPNYNNAILLNSYISNIFTIGRENTTLEPFIGIQEKMTPWFFENDWNTAYLCPKEGFLYLMIGDEEEINEALIIGIKIRRKRMSILWIEEIPENEERVLSFRAFRIISDKEYQISKKVYNTTQLKKINSIHDLYKNYKEEEENEEQEDNDFLDIKL